jgi:hypothetical protein
MSQTAEAPESLVLRKKGSLEIASLPAGMIAALRQNRVQLTSLFNTNKQDKQIIICTTKNIKFFIELHRHFSNYNSAQVISRLQTIPKCSQQTFYGVLCCKYCSKRTPLPIPKITDQRN